MLSFFLAEVFDGSERVHFEMHEKNSDKCLTFKIREVAVPVTSFVVSEIYCLLDMNVHLWTEYSFFYYYLI